MRSILRFWNKTTPNISQALPGWSLDVEPCDPAQGWGGVSCTALLANSTNTTPSADTSSEFYVVTSIWWERFLNRDPEFPLWFSRVMYLRDESDCHPPSPLTVSSGSCPTLNLLHRMSKCLGAWMNTKRTIIYGLAWNEDAATYHYIRQLEILESLKINANGWICDSISYCDDMYLCQIG